ncbi:tetratricopeptide repeat protein, partial [Lentzea tibetensis]|uniref:tetratricopeptide repeat protein n=1 Tax=Lentzea tibetensis TaxID=2591470 RepID=UPI001C99BB28
NNLGGCYTDLRRHNDAVSPTEEATTHYRALAATNPSYLPDLASALNNLGTRYGNIGRHNDAVSPTEEAVTLRRVQSADNPAYLPDLAMALNNLGNRYSNIGRHNDAVSPTEEAVTHYRALAATNPSYLPNLASALNNLTQLLVLFDGGGRVEEIWRDALDSVGSDAAAMLLLYRTDASPIGSPDSAKWLRAIETTGQRDLLGFAHELGRKHWRANPDAWAKAWTEAAHESTLPAWLTVDPNKLELVEAWLATPTYEAERDHLATHPELLDEVFDVAVQEVLLACDEAEARRYLELRATAQSVGAVAAYQPLVLGSLVATFTNADPVRQQQLLEERRDELQDDLVMEYMQQHVEGDESDGRLEVAMSLLDLARTGQNEPLSATFDALNDPELFAALLESTALKSNTPALEDIALVAFYTASTEPEAANALFYGAVAGAITTNDEADERLRAAIEYNPDQRNKWISQLARIGRVHPEVLALIDVLTETDDGE